MSKPSVLNSLALAGRLNSLGLASWAESLPPLIEQRLSSKNHGNYSRWQDILLALPKADRDTQEALLLELAPWRKGPFDLGDISIDAEWRSDLKWNRVRERIAPLQDRNVLDVGCGNGFYALQMRDAGAKTVIGIDPTLLFVMQFLAVNHFHAADNVFVVPARLQELPLPAQRFDTCFSMGVLYHQRAPIDHLRELRQTLRSGGQLVLETIYLPGEEPNARTPEDRYAKMRNVWLLPTLPELATWLTRTGYQGIEIIDKSITTVDEQRSTDWMTFESLRDALDPSDPTKTIEGWPAPHRVVLTATAP